MTALRILGIDPGLNRCGWGLIVAQGAHLSFVACGVIRPDAKASLAERLAEIFVGVQGLARLHGPDAAAVEETYVNSNPRAALVLGQARGVTLAALAMAGLPVAEYSPAVIKKGLVGSGRAEKEQVAFMVQRLLPAAGPVTADAADALAVALTHAAQGAFLSRVRLAESGAKP